jgi:hypothetical protein
MSALEQLPRRPVATSQAAIGAVLLGALAYPRASRASRSRSPRPWPHWLRGRSYIDLLCGTDLASRYRKKERHMMVDFALAAERSGTRTQDAIYQAVCFDFGP